MLEKQYDLIVNNDFKGFIQELFDEYWEFESLKSLKYKHTSKGLQEKYKLTPVAFSKVIRNSGYFVFNDELMDCGNCRIDIRIYNRPELQQLIKKSNHPDLFCEKCFSEKLTIEYEELANEFSQYFSLDNSTRLRKKQKELSYLEKIFTYNLLSQSSELNGIVKEDVWLKFKEVDALGMNNVINSLFEKNYIFSANYDTDLKELQKKTLFLFRSKDSKYLESDLIKKLRTILELDISENLYINIPENYDNPSSWLCDLHEEIINTKLTVEICKEIEEYVHKKRLLEIYKLINIHLEKEYIEVRKDNALEMEILRMINIYHLPRCNVIINYLANRTVKDLYKSIRRGTFLNNDNDNVFRENMTGFLDYIEGKDYESEFFKLLPDSWVTSEVEIYISTYIIKSYKRWDKNTPNEIVQMWLSTSEIDC